MSERPEYPILRLMIKKVTFDFETRSLCDLKKSGAYKYSLHPSTEPTCMAFKIFDNDNVFFFDFESINLLWKSPRNEKIKKIWAECIKENYLFSAHNAFFERCIYENILVKRYEWPSIPFKSYRCTAAKAAACALPRNLEGAGSALNLLIQKDKRGYAAMMATCKPTKWWTAWNKHRMGEEPEVFLEPKDNPQIWDTLYTYCKIDVKTEELLDRSLPDLSPIELKVWQLNQTLNWRGLRIDFPTVRKIVEIMAIENKKAVRELDLLTMGAITKPGARQLILDFLNSEGVKIENLQAKTVEDKLLGFDLNEDTRKLLELRKALSLTSTKKYQSFLDRVGEDHKVRDILLYHGASTGRDSGTGIQPHNFPKGLLHIPDDNPYIHVQNTISYDVDTLKLIYGDSLSILFSSILRNMIIPSEDHELFVADFSKIEVAVLWWLAGNKAGLKVLKDGGDPYIYQAIANTGKLAKDITFDDRQLAKAQVLGCGFGMGWEKFLKTAWDMYRLKLTPQEAQRAVSDYRTQNSSVPLLWRNYENAAISAVEYHGVIQVDKVKFIKDRDFLWIELPSKRRLAYSKPQTIMRETDWGPRKTLEFFSVNSRTKKWGLERTWGGTLTENIVQAVARDLMMQAILRLEEKGYKVLLTVHDEGICEKEKGKGDLKEFIDILCEIPPWAKDCPVSAKGWVGPRYRK